MPKQLAGVKLKKTTIGWGYASLAETNLRHLYKAHYEI